MTFLIKLLLAAFWMLLVPAAAGIIFLRKNNSISLAESFLTGYLFLFSLAELMILLMMCLNLPLHVLTVYYALVIMAAAAAGVIILFKYRGGVLAPAGSPKSELRRLLGGKSLFFWAAVILIFLQVAVVVIYGHLDADDALYVGAATTAIHSDTIFRVNSYTGNLYNNMPRRYILSPFPIFLAVMSQLSGGLHAAIMAHTVFPAIFLPTAYVVMYVLARRWFPDDKDAQGIFLFLTVVLSWFSAYSIYNAGDFQMIRIWQGKAILAAIMLPFLFYLSLSILMEEKPAYSWLLYAMANLSACLLSSMGIILAPVMMGVFLFLSLLKFRSLKRFLRGALCCAPSIILGIVYILIPILRGRGLL